MEKKYTSLVVIGSIVAVFFLILVFARLKRTETTTTGQATPAVRNEVSPSASLTFEPVEFGTHALYLFSSVTCPHSQNVASFLETQPNLAAERDLIVASLDNTQDTTNQEQFVDYATECGLARGSGVGIPFLYINDTSLEASQRCLIGDGEIINYLTEGSR